MLEATLNSSPLGMTVVKSLRAPSGKITDFTYVWLNRVAAGMAAKDVIGKHMCQLYPHVKENGLFDTYVDTVEHNRPLDFEEYYQQGEKWFRWSGNRFHDGLFIIVEDITERKQAAREVLRMKDELAKKTTDKYHTLFNSIDEGFCIIELIFDEKRKAVDWVFVETNYAFARHTGLAHTTGKTAREITPDMVPAAIETYAEVLHTGRSVRFERYVPGSDHWFDIYASRIGDGKTRQLAIVFNDITKRKKLEQQRDDFISIASHELRTPITSIKAYAEMIGGQFEQAGDTDNALLMSKLNSQVDRLTLLINALLDTTKLSQGQLELHRESFDLNSLIDERLEELRRTWQTHRLTVQYSGTLAVTADRERISQVLVNLVSNAVKYSPAGSSVVITGSQTEEGIRVCVQDQGIGIPEEELEKVFDRFFRTGDQRAHTVPGMGLGLYITAGIIRRHGGTIRAESEPGKGSRFCFTLPLIAPEE